MTLSTEQLHKAAQPKIPTTSAEEVPRVRGYYSLPQLDPEPLVSVTSVLGASLPKPGLERWKRGRIAEWCFEHPHATVAEAEAALDGDKTAMNRGSEVHNWARARILGTANVIPKQIAGYAKAFEAWRSQAEPEFEYTELTVANLSLGYAGTLDAVVREKDGTLTLVDFKTGGVYPDYGIQLSAYAHAEKALDIEENVLDLPRFDNLAVIQLTPEGTWGRHGMRDDFDVFVALLHVYKRTRGKPCREACPLEHP